MIIGTICNVLGTFRAHSMEAKHDLFWTQADFGYIKDVVNSMMKLCKPQHKVFIGQYKNITLFQILGRFIIELC